MSVVIDQVSGRVEPEAGAPVGRQGGEAAAPQEPQDKRLPCQLRRLERRRLRLEAD
jgi:hypothetical protein